MHRYCKILLEAKKFFLGGTNKCHPFISVLGLKMNLKSDFNYIMIFIKLKINFFLKACIIFEKSGFSKFDFKKANRLLNSINLEYSRK